MKQKVSELLLRVAAMEEKWAGDQKKLGQLHHLRRRIAEEIEETGSPPPIEIVESLLTMIDRGTLPEADALRPFVAQVLAEWRENSNESSEKPVGAKWDTDYRPATYWADGKCRPYRGTLRSDIAFPLYDEFLPRYEREDVEIARVSLASTTGDVISIRAHRGRKFISYRVVDEYESEFECTPKRRTKPLTLAELISLIDTAKNKTNETEGLVICFLEYNMEGVSKPEELIGFVTVTSEYYLGLRSYYEQRISEFLEGRLADLDEDAEDEEA